MGTVENKVISFEPFVAFLISFHNRVMSFSETINNLQSSGLYSDSESSLVEEALLIQHVAQWEHFLQNIVAYCVSLDTGKINDELKISLTKKIGFNNAYAILNGLDFLSLTTSDKVISFSKKYITNEHNPFSMISKSLLQTIDHVYILRNYLIHKSHKSKLKLLSFYKNIHQISGFIKPGDFLQQPSELYGSTVVRSHLYYGNFMLMATEIWKFLDKTSYSYVFEDDESKEGLISGLKKMNEVFTILSKNAQQS